MLCSVLFCILIVIHQCNTVPEVSDDKPFNCGRAKQIYYPAPVDCHSYYQCVGQSKLPVKLYCDSGLQFNPITQTCDRPANVANVRPECDYNSESLLKEVNNFHFKLPSAKVNMLAKFITLISN